MDWRRKVCSVVGVTEEDARFDLLFSVPADCFYGYEVSSGNKVHIVIISHVGGVSRIHVVSEKEETTEKSKKRGRSYYIPVAAYDKLVLDRLLQDVKEERSVKSKKDLF